MDIQKFIGRSKGFVKLKLPTILSAFAATTSVGAIFLAVKAEKNAQERIGAAGTTEEEEVNGVTEHIWIPPSKKEERMIYADEFAPVAFLELMTVTAIFASDFTSQKRIYALSNAVALATARVDALERKVEEKFDKDKLDEIKQEISQDAVDEKLKEFEHLPDNQFLWYDPHYKRCFITSEKNVLRAVNSVNSIFEEEGYATLSLFYYYLDIKAPEASLVEGFTVDQVIEYWGEIKIPINYHMKKTKTGTEYFELEYNCDIKTVVTAEDAMIAYYG